MYSFTAFPKHRHLQRMGRAHVQVDKGPEHVEDFQARVNWSS